MLLGGAHERFIQSSKALATFGGAGGPGKAEKCRNEIDCAGNGYNQKKKKAFLLLETKMKKQP